MRLLFVDSLGLDVFELFAGVNEFGAGFLGERLESGGEVAAREMSTFFALSAIA